MDFGLYTGRDNNFGMGRIQEQAGDHDAQLRGIWDNFHDDRICKKYMGLSGHNVHLGNIHAPVCYGRDRAYPGKCRGTYAGTCVFIRADNNIRRYASWDAAVWAARGCGKD